jgi:hypothetical protein
MQVTLRGTKPLMSCRGAPNPRRLVRGRSKHSSATYGQCVKADVGRQLTLRNNGWRFRCSIGDSDGRGRGDGVECQDRGEDVRWRQQWMESVTSDSK